MDTGEASPNNCKAPYPFAMAEKRLKDRLILKLINAYEYGIYSDPEADNFKTMIETNSIEVLTISLVVLLGLVIGMVIDYIKK